MTLPLNEPSLWQKLKKLLIGRAHDPHDTQLFHNISLIAFFAWIGLGSDGLSSVCYGPQEAFLALGSHIYLSVFVAIGTALTIMIISASYSQIIELFPSGGGGYLVASKLLSPNVGMVSGCALLIDYVLTITVSVASGTDAIFSFVPVQWHPFKLEFALLILVLLIVLNLRGAKESIITLLPIFLVFIATHALVITYAFFDHASDFPVLLHETARDVKTSYGSIGLMGMLVIILKAYSMGAGTYTGIEAVSNGMSVLREPKVATAKKTMRYMSWSLVVTVVGLMIAYLLYRVELEPGKTLNAVLFTRIAADWGGAGSVFVLITLLSEAVLLFVAAQTGFLGGPRVLASMALDKWFPARFTVLSDRFVNQNGIVIMGLAALIMMVISHGSVTFLVILYSINVFITFTLSQLGMVRHWWQARSQEPEWKKKMIINGTGLVLTIFILASMIIVKFDEGGWITIVVTGGLVAVAVIIKRHYISTALLLRRLSSLVTAVGIEEKNMAETMLPVPYDPKYKTAVIFVSGYNGLGLHTLFGIIRLFEGVFRNFVFVRIGVIDAGNFKGVEEIQHLENKSRSDVERYVRYMRSRGYSAEGVSCIGTDVIEQVRLIAPDLTSRYPNAVFFGGQLVFPEDTFYTRWLHNYTVFVMQRMFYSQGIPFVLLPIRV